MARDPEEVEAIKYCEFVSNRITELRMKRDVSEYKMSLELGQNRSYIQNISSKKAMPSLFCFFKICEYFEITPIEFFDASLKEPDIYTFARKEIGRLSPEDVEILMSVIQRFLDKN